MAIPDFQSIMLPLLKFSNDGSEHSLEQARKALAQRFELTAEDRADLLPSGRQRRFDNRVAWAKVYLEQAGLLTSPRRGHFVITSSGRQLLLEEPERIDIPLLDRYEEFRAFRTSSRKSGSDNGGVQGVPITAAIATPEEAFEAAYQSIRAELTANVLARVKAASPSFFESMVVELLVSMGYGGSRAEAGKTIGGSGDEGIDGIISEDKLGLDVIYVQAKRWEGTVGRPEVQKFVGALHGKRAHKGVFITTGAFSDEARQYVVVIDPRVVLIDGQTLAGYMVDHNIGVIPRSSYHLKRVDTDYFDEE
jgi:restriction system protein